MSPELELVDALSLDEELEEDVSVELELLEEDPPFELFDSDPRASFL